MKKPDLLVLIAVWEFITAFGALIGIGAIAIFAFPDAIDDMLGSAIPGAIFGLSIAILVLICYISIAIAGGVGLLKGRGMGAHPQHCPRGAKLGFISHRHSYRRNYHYVPD